MIQRQFYILATILKEVFEKPLEREVHRMQRYDNFLKRGITKKRSVYMVLAVVLVIMVSGYGSGYGYFYKK